MEHCERTDGTRYEARYLGRYGGVDFWQCGYRLVDGRRAEMHTGSFNYASNSTLTPPDYCPDCGARLVRVTCPQCGRYFR